MTRASTRRVLGARAIGLPWHPCIVDMEGFIMRWGLVVALVGAVSFIIAGSALEWQRFAVAEVSTTALELGLTGWLALLVSAFVAAASVFGLATGRRA
ncbi:MAG TPA: hypothetical protein PK095_05745, partial [Myxococcota bacterium]|nr:hypothetical protein [Myxococcota bacterium]